MRKPRTHVLAVLGRARPARLDADTAVRTNWPTAAKLMETAELADDDPVAETDHARLPTSVRRRPLVPVKLVGALASAAVTAVVIVVAVFAGAVVLRAPHHQPTAVRSSPGQRSAGRLVFRALPLGPHWHGHLAYAVNYGVVYLAGKATQDRHVGQSVGPMATLPPSARPAGQLNVVAIVSAGAGSIKIGADGQIEVTGQHAAVTSVSLDGVSFPVGSG
ncbi:MAG TPA: hypothetical protein VN767_12535 [Streptosporangiaceae bacterium]|jgi:hypothetical protein|nr:hypothetical protein [Streptosporangiaceae bacterium]